MASSFPPSSMPLTSMSSIPVPSTSNSMPSTSMSNATPFTFTSSNATPSNSIPLNSTSSNSMPSTSMSSNPVPSTPIWCEPHLRRAFQTSLNALPPAHLLPLLAGEAYPTRESAVTRMKDFGFSEGFVIVGEGGGPRRAKLRCCQGGKETQNNRKLSEEDRKRQTKTQASGCPYKVYAYSYKQKDGTYIWKTGFSNPVHDHPPVSDPFRHPKTRARHPNFQLCMQNAERDRRRGISFTQATSIIGEDEYEIDKKTYYNLCQPGKSGSTEVVKKWKVQRGKRQDGSKDSLLKLQKKARSHKKKLPSPSLRTSSW